MAKLVKLAAGTVLVLAALMAGKALLGAGAPEAVRGTCVMVGDSIALGVGRMAPECVTVARSGIRSDDYAARFTGQVFAQDLLVLSLGTNDALPGPPVDTLAMLRVVRARVHGKRVVWLMPVAATEAGKQAVATVAAENGDAVMDIAAEVAKGRDGVHPASPGMRRIALALLP